VTAYRRQILGFLDRIGASDVAVTGGRHGHPQLCFRFHGTDYRTGIANTPSDANAAMLKIYDLRRQLGLAHGERHIGTRRLRRRRSQHRPPECPALSTLPDRWRAPLAALLAAMLAEEAQHMREAA
jgi:hypothetical protein